MNLCVTEGLIRGSEWGTPFFRFAAGCRPTKRLVLTMNNHDDLSRVDVLPDGRTMWVGGAKKHGWVSVSGLVLTNERGENVRLLHGWENYGKAYGQATITKVGTLCVLSGLLQGLNRQSLALMPSYCTPDFELLFLLLGKTDPDLIGKKREVGAATTGDSGPQTLTIDTRGVLSISRAPFFMSMTGVLFSRRNAGGACNAPE